MASNLFAGSGRWDDVRRVRKKLKWTSEGSRLSLDRVRR